MTQLDSADPKGKYAGKRTFVYYDLIMATFVTVLLCSNLIGTEKVCKLGGVTFGAGILFFPISYFFGDILTEVYGYARSRKVVWAGFGAMIFASVMSWVVVHLPAADDWTHQAELSYVFGQTPRIVAASLLAYFAGEFGNSFTLAKMKILTQGRMLWSRTIGSTVVGEAVDSLIFYPMAFYGVWPNSLILKVMAANYCLKVAWEVLMTPVTYKLVQFLKRVEDEDFYDYKTSFTPFSLKA